MRDMTVRYEANPPKILPGVDTSDSIQRFVERIRIISKRCDAVHLTEDVLGLQRVLPITVGRIIREEIPDLSITASLRVRDKSEDEISGCVRDYIDAGFAGILILMGDPSQRRREDSGQIPSLTVKRLGKQGIDSEIDLYLSISNKPDFSKIGKKLDARPKGFMTQVIQNLSQVQDLSHNLKGFATIPILLYPSPKNTKSAKFLNLDLRSYSQEFEELLNKTYKITGDVLLTSPNDFTGLSEFLERFSAQSTKYFASG